MRTEVYLRSDISAVLSGLLAAHGNAAGGSSVPAYSAGFAAAVRAMALAFAIDPDLTLGLPEPEHVERTIVILHKRPLMLPGEARHYSGR